MEAITQRYKPGRRCQIIPMAGDLFSVPALDILSPNTSFNIPLRNLEARDLALVVEFRW